MNTTSFNTNTPQKVREILEWARENRKRIRVYYGDKVTGRDWCGAHNMIGYIGRSCGQVKVPLLMCNRNSCYGPAVMDDCIVKITYDHQVLYQHPDYYMPLKIEGNQIVDDRGLCYFYNKDHSKVIREYKWFTGHNDRH